MGSLLFVLVVGLVAAIVWKRMRGDDWEREAALSAALDEVLADTLDDLRAEQDPRRAVIRAFARMEKTSPPTASRASRPRRRASTSSARSTASASAAPRCGS